MEWKYQHIPSKPNQYNMADTPSTTSSPLEGSTPSRIDKHANSKLSLENFQAVWAHSKGRREVVSIAEKMFSRLRLPFARHCDRTIFMFA